MRNNWLTGHQGYDAGEVRLPPLLPIPPANLCSRLSPASSMEIDGVGVGDLRIAGRASRGREPQGRQIPPCREWVGAPAPTEIEGDLWTLPASRTKNSLEHLVPLSAAAVELLTTLPRIAGRPGYVFTRTGTAPISDYSSSKAKLDAAMLTIAREDAFRLGQDKKSVQIKPWRLHDLRRTCSTGLAKLGQPIHVVEAVLNHRSGAISGVAAVYNRYQYLAEKRTALESVR